MTQPSSDAEAIVASWESPERFHLIFERHYRTIFRFVVGAVGAADGPELCDEVFTRAFESRRRYDPAYPSAKPWLFGIASNLVNGYWRRRARELKAYKRASRMESVDEEFEDDIVRRLAAQAERPRIASAVLRLRREEAEVVLLFALENLSYAEIAQALSIPEGTVRSRLNRARKRLRNLLDPYGETSTEQ